MKIVEAISDSNIGGAGIVLLTRLTTDTEYKNDTTVLIPRGSALKERLIENNIHFIETDICKDKSWDIKAVFEYMKILNSLSPDIINCHSCLSCRVAAWLCGISVRVYTRHCAFPLKKYQKNIIVKFIFSRLQLILSDHIIAVADAAKENLTDMGIPKDKITVIINGVHGIKRKTEEERRNIRSSLNIPHNAIVVGIFARLESYKGHYDFIKAAKYLIERNGNFRFLIVGKGSEEESLKELCKKYKLEEYLIFTGFVNDISDYMNITDINVNCSYGTETSSLALSEGMSLGIPAVVSDYGGNPYMVKNGKNGFIYSAHNSDALAKRIYLLAFSNTLYKRMSEESLIRFKNELNAKEMSRQTYALYERLFSTHVKSN